MDEITPINDESTNNSDNSDTTIDDIPVQSQDDSPVDNTPIENDMNNQQSDDLGERLERLGGEPAPVITPEEFARLQKAGQVHIDARGRVRTSRRSDADAGVSLRKRRAWYAR